MEKIIKIAITGPESTGKSQLAAQLAAHYRTVYVPEFARTYIDNLDRPYKQRDLIAIAEGQITSENGLLTKANHLLFCDTELTVIKIWSKYKYGNVDPYILQKLSEISYDFYLLADIDLPWVFDKQREQPEKRAYFFDWFQRELKSRNLKFHLVSGTGVQRFENACRAVDDFLQSVSR
jgi:NadR type nicotinamide-nucleotide adenylyltransferase